jgi:hypothetical protein
MLPRAERIEAQPIEHALSSCVSNIQYYSGCPGFTVFDEIGITSFKFLQVIVAKHN